MKNYWLVETLQNPKLQKYALVAGSYAAGAYGGPLAKQGVEAYGPVVGGWLLKGLILLLGG
jgi:hypothetical protein